MIWAVNRKESTNNYLADSLQLIDLASYQPNFTKSTMLSTNNEWESDNKKKLKNSEESAITKINYNRKLFS